MKECESLLKQLTKKNRDNIEKSKRKCRLISKDDIKRAINNKKE